MATLLQAQARVKAPVKATLADLARVAGKAELVKGEIIAMPPTGGDPGYTGDETYASLREYAKRTKLGRAVGDNKAFRVNLPHRESLSPDAAFYIGPSPGMKFYEGAPVLAIEVRSENDYGPQAERELAQKRLDYFTAGALVVWDVDLLAQVVRSYHADDPSHPQLFHRGQYAHAEPAVPGWSVLVDDLFPPAEENSGLLGVQ